MSLKNLREKRLLNVVARGEHSNHSHVVVGNCTAVKSGNDTVVTVENSKDYDAYLKLYSKLNKDHEKLVVKFASDIETNNRSAYNIAKSELYNKFQKKVAGMDVVLLKHILESNYLETGEEVWTKEHFDVPVRNGKTTFFGQTEFNPLNKMIERVRD